MLETIENLRLSVPHPFFRVLCEKREDADELRVPLIGLRRIADARGGIAKVAKAAGIERDGRVGQTLLSDVFSSDS